MRSITYTEIKKLLTIVGKGEKGETQWFFDPSSLNGDLKPWDDEYLDPVYFFTKRPRINDAAQRAALCNGIKLIWK